MTTPSATPNTLTVGQIADLRLLADNPHRPLQAQRRKLFMRLGLIVPTAERRPPREDRGDPPPRAHALTPLGRRVVAEEDARRAGVLRP